MTRDALHPDDDAGRPARPVDSARPAADREVPIARTVGDTRPMAASVHAWLDGDGGELAARRDAPAEVELWTRVMRELGACRGRRAPVGVLARVMGALD